MKRTLFGKTLKQTFLVIPAAALMLGASQAQTTIGLNFQSYYYSSGTTPQTVGFGAGYQTTGFPVTATAFGVSPANWFNADPLGSSFTTGYATFGGVNTTFAGGLTASVTAPDAWESGIGELNDGFNDPSHPGIPETIPAGNDQVTWGYLDDGGGAVPGGYPAATVSGLATQFPNGYVIQTIAAEGNVATFADVVITDGTTTNTLAYSTYYVANNPAVNPDVAGGTVGLSPASGAFTANTIYITGGLKSGSDRSTLAGFIITDKPVVSQPPASVTNLSGATLTLSAGVIGLTNDLNYQWQTNGVNLPGATSATYTKAGVTTNNSGNYTLVVTNLYGAATSEVASVTILPPTTYIWNGNVNGTWDIASTANWTANGVATTYADGTQVQFDDTAVTTSVSNAVMVSPFSVTVTNNTKSYTISGSPIGGSASLIKSGTNTLTLSGTNTFSGNIAINAGALAIGGAGQLGGGAYAGNITNNGSFIDDSTASQTLNGAISGSGSLAQNGSGTLTLSQPLTAANTYTGGLTVNAGTVLTAVPNGSAYGSVGNGNLVVNNGGVIQAITDNSLVGATTSGSKTVTINAGGMVTNNSSQSCHLNAVVLNGGTLAANTAQPSYGNWNFDYGVSTLGNGSSSTIAGGNVILTQTGGSVFNILAGDTVIVSSVVDHTTFGADNGLIKSGAGTLALLAVNAYASPTTVNGGALQVSGSLNSPVTVNGGSLSLGLPSTGPITINNTLTVNAGGTVYLKLNKTGGSLSSDSVQGLSSVSYGGTLTVTNITSDGTPLASGDTVQLFPSSSYTGSFANYILPALPAGLTWDTSQLTVSGSLDVMVGTPVTEAPTFNPPAGTYYTGAQTVTISSGNPPGATIYYTTNGSTPTSSSPSGITPVTVTVPANTVLTIQAYAQAPSSTASSIVNATYNTIKPGDISLVEGSTPAAFWPLSEPSGPTAFDLSGNGLDGAYSGAGVTYGVTGPVGNNTVVILDGASGNVTVPYSATLNPSGAFTAEGWFNPASVTSSLICALSSVNPTSPRSGWLIYESTAGWELRTYDQNGTTPAVDITGGTPTVGQWNHVAVVWNGTNGYIYVDGVLQNTSAATNYVANGSDPFTIGERSDGDFLWPGSVGNVAFYGRALSAQEIQTHALNSPFMNISKTGANAVVSWLPAGGGTLQAAPAVTGVYTNVSGATSPWTNSPAGGSRFYRVQF